MKNQLTTVSLAIFLIICGFNNSIPATLFPSDDAYLAVADEMPAPIGGLEQLYKKITYPDFAKKTKVEGKVFVLAFINEDGDVDDVKLIKGIGMGCDDEVLNAVKKTKFKPAHNKGLAVKAKFPIAFAFKLQ